jgi:hypothetical protein
VSGGWVEAVRLIESKVIDERASEILINATINVKTMRLRFGQPMTIENWG